MKAELAHLPELWRKRAVTLDLAAASYYRQGDVVYARELEEAAYEYRIAADALEASGVLS